MEERWAPIPSHPTYQVSTLGRVRNAAGRRLYGCVRKDRYIQLSLPKRNVMVQIVVLEAFVGPRPDGKLALHKDDDRQNNRLANLYWGTAKDNANDRVGNHRRRGAKLASARLTDDQVRLICQRLDAGLPMRTIAAEFGVTDHTITKINLGHSWPWLTGRSTANSRNAGYGEAA